MILAGVEMGVAGMLRISRIVVIILQPTNLSSADLSWAGMALPTTGFQNDTVILYEGKDCGQCTPELGRHGLFLHAHIGRLVEALQGGPLDSPEEHFSQYKQVVLLLLREGLEVFVDALHPHQQCVRRQYCSPLNCPNLRP